MTRAQDHRVTIERRGRSHRAVCACGWASHSWNELRPAEADAWHHIFGDEPIIDVSAVADRRQAAVQDRVTKADPEPLRSRAVEHLVRQAHDLAGKPSPYSRDAAPELWRVAEHDTVAIQSAVTEVEELLARHERQSARAADSEWLQLITAKRLLLQALALGEDTGRRRALL